IRDFHVTGVQTCALPISHSNRSDGTDTPAELVRNAKAAGLDVVALTDHDATTGWDEAQAAADEVGIRLVRGIEVSTKWQGASVQIGRASRREGVLVRDVV